MRFRFYACGALCLSMMAAEDIAPLGTYRAAERRHWAFQKRSNPETAKFTAAADQGWVKNPVDAFIADDG